MTTLRTYFILNFIFQLIADFHEWYNGNEHTFENKFPLLKNKLISLFEKVSNQSRFVKELKDLAKSEFFKNLKL